MCRLGVEQFLVTDFFFLDFNWSKFSGSLEPRAPGCIL